MTEPMLPTVKLPDYMRDQSEQLYKNAAGRWFEAEKALEWGAARIETLEAELVVASGLLREWLTKARYVSLSRLEAETRAFLNDTEPAEPSGYPWSDPRSDPLGDIRKALRNAEERYAEDMRRLTEPAEPRTDKFYRVTFEPLTLDAAERLAEALMGYLTETEEHDGQLVPRHWLYEDASAAIEPVEGYDEAAASSDTEPAEPRSLTTAGTWHHARWFEPHPAQPDLSLAYVQPGTGKTEAPCLTCVEGGFHEVVIFEPDTEAAASTRDGEEKT